MQIHELNHVLQHCDGVDIHHEGAMFIYIWQPAESKCVRTGAEHTKLIKWNKINNTWMWMNEENIIIICYCFFIYIYKIIGVLVIKWWISQNKTSVNLILRVLEKDVWSVFGKFSGNSTAGVQQLGQRAKGRRDNLTFHCTVECERRRRRKRTCELETPSVERV